MENHRIKSLSLDPRSRNRFRYATQKQREQRATADVYRGYKRRIGVASSANREEAVHHTKEPPVKKNRTEEDASPSVSAITDLQSASLAEELDLAFDRNPSEVFSKFYRQIWYHVRSLPEILHHREIIVQLMLDYLLTAEEGASDEEGIVRYQPNQATTDILHLLAVLARDLRHEIHPFLHTKILPRLVNDLLNPPIAKKQHVPLDVSIIEACIRTMSYCFRYDSETLVSETSKEGDQPCLEPMRQYYGKTLAHRREVVRRLSAQALAPLIRRLPSESARKRHLKRIFRAMSSVASDSIATQRAQQNAADGISLLCLELVQGVSGQMHSKGQGLMKTILECSCAHHEKEPANKLLMDIGKKFLEGLCANLKAAVACTVYEHLMKLLTKYTQEKKDSVSIMTLLELSKQIVVFEDGALVRTSDSIKNTLVTLKAFFEPSFLIDLFPDARAASFGLLCLIWRVHPKDKNVAESVVGIIESAIPVLLRDEGGHRFLLGLLSKKILPVLPLSLSMRKLGSILLRSAAQQKNRDFIVSLILALSSVQEVDQESYVETDTVMFLENALRCDVSLETCESLMEQCIVDVHERQFYGNVELVSSTIQSVVFVGMLCCRKTVTKREMMNMFKQVTLWIHSSIEKIVLTGEYKSKGNVGLPFAICFSLAVDGLTQYCAAIRDLVGEADVVVKESLVRVKDSVASHLENYPFSLWTVKSCAAFARLLKDITGKVLIDDSNKAFDLLVPNLSRPSHFLRLHCLEILSTYPDKPYISDHADLDLADDLDEEPSTIPQNEEGKKSGFSGVCQILHTLISIEKTTADLRNERKLTSSLATIEVQGRSGKLPVPYVEAAVSHMIGLLYVRFSPMWPSVQSAIVSLVQGCDQYTWPYLQKKIEEMMFCPPFSSQSSPEELDFYDGAHILKAYTMWDQTSGLEVSMFRTSITVSEDNGRVSRHLVRSVDDVVLSLWGTLEKKANLIVQHSRDVVNVIMRFLVLYFYREDDPDAIELKLRLHVQSNGISQHNESLGRKAVENRMLAILKVFTKVNGPQQMHKHTVLFPVFVSLLSYTDSLAQAALSSMLKFKPHYLLPYADVMKKLFVKGKMREALLELKELKKDGTIPCDHRKKLVPLITRILLGRVSSKNTSRSAKDSPSARRTAALSFLSGFCEGQEEIYPAIYLAIRQFAPLDALKENEHQTLEDRQLLLLRMREVGKQECSRLPTSVHEGFLNILEAIISQLGLHVIQFVPIFISIVLGLLQMYPISTSKQQQGFPPDDGEDDPQNSRSSRIRALCFRRLSEIFDRFASTHDFTDDIERLWECVGPSLEGLPESAASSDKSPALMIFLRTLSGHAKLIPFLQLKHQTTQAMVESLGKANSASAVDTILSFIENLLGLDEIGTEINHIGPEIVRGHIASLLDSFKCRMSRSGHSITLKREIRVLCGVSELIAKNNDITNFDTATVNALAELLLPYLSRESRLSDQHKSHIVSVLQTLIPGLTKDVAKVFYLSLSQTLGPSKNGEISLATRYAIAETLYRVAASHFDSAKPAANVLLGLCALNSKRVGELDYDSSITMLQRLSIEQDELSWSGLSIETTEWLAPLIQICFQFLHDDDGVLSRTALKALRVLVVFASSRCDSDKDICAEKNSWTRLLEGLILPMTRSGLHMTGDSIRRMYVQLLSTIVSECKGSDSLHLHGDLAVLLRGDNIDLDFFQGISHVQIHRRAKALTRLRRELDGEDKKSCRFSLQSLSNILLPLVMHPIYETKSKDEDSFALEAVSTIGSIARLLSWSKYNNLIGTLLNQFSRHPDQEKYLVGTICSVLDNMDFDLVSGDTDTESAVMRTLERRIIPKTEALLTKEVKKSGKKEKTIRPSIVLALLKLAKRLPSDFFHLKLHRLLAVICDALKNRDSSIREIARKTLGKMAVSVEMVYLADIVRELAISLKEGYQLHVRSASIHTILLELVDQLKDGAELSYSYADRVAFDSSVPALLDLLQEDMFGAAQERKDAEGESQIRFVKEAGGSKSMHSLELIALMISFDPVTNTKGKRATIDVLVAPFLERLKSPGQNSKGIRRVKECLDRIVQGLLKNTTLTAEKAFGLSYATILYYIQQDPKQGKSASEDDEDRLEENAVATLNVSSSAQKTSLFSKGRNDKVNGSLSEWLPSVQHMPKTDREAVESRRIESRNLRKVQDGSSAPILTGSGRRAVVSGKDNVWNNPASSAAVTFGLQTLQIALKKDARRTELLDPFVPLLSDCICMSGDTEILRLSMKALGGMLNTELPSIKNCSARLSEKTVDLLATSSGNEELQHSCFKLLMYLLKAGKTGESSGSNDPPLLNDHARMDVLLSFVRQSILESEQHSQATSLLKVIVSLKYSSPDLYDLMECLLEQSVRSPKESLRLQCSVVYLSFLLNYPMTEDRLEQELKQVILNVGYEYSDGRLSAVKLVNLIVSKLPVELVENKSQLFFLPLTMQLANDSSDECRLAVAVCIKSLLGRISFETCFSLFEYTSRWTESSERLLKRTALQLYCLFLEASPSFCRRQEVAHRLLSNVEEVLDQVDDNDWETAYFAMSSLEKLSTECLVDPFDGTRIVFSTAVLDGVVHDHAWVQLVSNRLLWKHLKTLDPTSFHDMNQSSTFLSEKGVLFKLGRNLCSVLSMLSEESSSSSNESELTTTVIKSLTWTIRAMQKYPSLCFSGDSIQEDKSPTRWVLKRLSGIAKPKVRNRRQAVFKCFASFVASGPQDVLKDNLDCILEPLHRVELESSNDTPSNQWQHDREPAALSAEAELAQEVLRILESTYDDAFLEAYGAVRKKAKTNKEERKRYEKAEAARDPRLAAEQKIQKQMQEKKRRKRRVDERRKDRGVGSAKRRHVNQDD